MTSQTETNGLHPLIHQRRSPRAFADRAVDDATLATLLEAARWAPSCYNEQPWYFLLAQRNRPGPFERLADCLVPFNRAWAAKAPVLMLAAARLNFAHNGQENRHALHDVGLAMAQLTLQATALGLGVHQMAGFDPEAARISYHIPEGIEPVSITAIGYFGDANTLPEELREKETAPRERQAPQTFIFTDRWEQPWSP